MDVSFLLGRAGSGKTFKIVNDVTTEIIKHPKTDLNAPPIFVLVPDQFALNTDLLIMQNLARHQHFATTRLNVCSFNRLINLALENTANIKRPKLSEFGYLLICQQAIKECLNQLYFYKSPTPFLAAELIKTISELIEYRINPEDLKFAAENLNAPVLCELALIYKKFVNLIHTNFRNQMSDTEYALQQIHTHPMFKNSIVFMDGFANLNQLQEDILIALCNVAKSVTISICLDPNDMPDLQKLENWDDSRLFATTEKMLIKLITRLPDYNIIKLGEPQRFIAHDLKQLEATKLNPQARIEACENIELWKCSNQYEEVKAVIRDIIRAHEIEKIPFNKMAIAVSNIEDYYQQLSFMFQYYRIPYVLDYPLTLGHHPYCQLVIIILRLCVFDFQWHDIIDLIRTDLTNLSREEGWLLETFIADYHISGSTIWLHKDNWQLDISLEEELDEILIDKHQKRLKIVDNIRKKLLPFLNEINQLNQKNLYNGSEISTLIRNIIENNTIINKIEKWGTNSQTAIVHKTAIDQVLQLLSEITVLTDNNDYRPLADWQMQIEQAIRLIHQRVPPMQNNSVIIGTIEQSRMPELHTLYLIGMNDNVFPRSHVDSPIINSIDREKLRSRGISIGPTIVERQYYENYLSYIAITRPSQRLILSYSIQNKKGDEQQPCALIGLIEQITKKKIVYRIKPSCEDYKSTLHINDLIENILTAAKDNSLNEFSSYLSVREQYDYVFNVLQKAKEIPVGGEICKNTVANLLIKDNYYETSVSALETYSSCPYKFYLGYLVNLPEKREEIFTNIVLGNLIHKALARMSIKLQKNNINWGNANLLAELLDSFNIEVEIFNYLTTGKKKNIWQVELLKQYGMIILSDFGWFLNQWAQELNFRPVEFEWNFSKAEPIMIDNNYHVALRGKVDRVDLIDDKYVLIVDYKLKPKTFDYSFFLEGINLQLPVYVLAYNSNKNKKFEAIGCLYQNIIPNKNKKKDDNKLLQWQQRGVVNIDKMQSIINKFPISFYNVSFNTKGELNFYSDAVYNNEFELLTYWAKKKIVDICKCIINSQFIPAPITYNSVISCQYCNYAKACRFDRLSANPRKIKKIKKKDFYQLIGDKDVI